MFKQTLSCLTLLPLVAFLPPARAAAPIEPVMVRIPAGEFSMGGGASSDNPAALDPAALPIHRVRIPAFQLGKYEVTVKEFRQFVQATGYKLPEQCRHEPGPRWFPGPTAGRFDRNALTDSAFQPAVCIGWAAAQAYANWLAAETGKALSPGHRGRVGIRGSRRQRLGLPPGPRRQPDLHPGQSGRPQWRVRGAEPLWRQLSGLHGGPHKL